MPSDVSAALPMPGRKAGAFTFAALFTLESLVRSLNASVISIQAYDLLASSRNVSIVSTAVAFCVLATTLLLPIAFHRLRRRWAYTFGIVFSMAAAFFLASHTVVGQIAGTYFRSAGASIMNVTLALYILDHIRKADYARVEPLRLAVSTISWSAGPAIGISLYISYGALAPQLVVLAASVLLLGTFWYLRLADPLTLPQGNLQKFNPLANVHRFVSQPRLRLAWAIAFVRSCFWSALFIYGPILIIESGLSKSFGGYMIAVSQLLLPLGLLFGWIALRVGVRHVIAGCFAGMALSSLIAGVVGIHAPYTTVFFFLLGALFASGLDGVGGIPYMRAVKPRERQQMTSVYRTFIEIAEIGPGFIFALLLTIFPTAIVFIVISGLALILSLLCWLYLPKSL